MNPLDDLPERGDTHDLALEAENAFRSAIQADAYFVLQGEDRSDYGTDFQLEARVGEAMTNMRTHVQLKGTEKAPNLDGSVSISIDRTNLNYLLAQPNAMYLCYHVPTDRLLARPADDVYRQYQHGVPNWHKQSSLTVRLHEVFDSRYQARLHAKLVSVGKSSRDWRLAWHSCKPEAAVKMIQEAPALIEVPFDPQDAAKLLQVLFDRGMDRSISGSFSRFEAVLGSIHGAMNPAYMAEVNLGINGYSFDRERVRRGIEVFEGTISHGNSHPGVLRYCQANAYLALGELNAARSAYVNTLVLLDGLGLTELESQCSKNLGSTLENLGYSESARAQYERALELNPDLGEAHFALGMWHNQHGGDLGVALEHFDKVIACRDTAIKVTSIQGWRVQVLFRLGDIDGAFREVNALLSQADSEPWIRPWCARQVSEFGASGTRALERSIAFWRSYLRDAADDIAAKFQLLLCHWHLRANDAPTMMPFSQFKESMSSLALLEGADVAFIWDRIGHWAQYDEDWREAEQAYRVAYELDPIKYGYCFGVALNFLDRSEEALPILLAQAQKHQPDAMSWFQVAVACEGVGDIPNCAEAYIRAIELQNDYELAWFNLGGVYWNSGDYDRAISVWDEAIRRYPKHELAIKLKKDLFTLSSGNQEDP